MMSVRSYLIGLRGSFFMGALTACGLVGTASANVLANPGFEDPVILPGAEVPGAADWSSFNGAFTISSIVDTPNSGDNSLKVFGVAGVFQDFAASEGQTWNGGAWVRNPSNDLMGDGQVAAVNIEWLDGGLNQIDFISNGDFVGATAPVDEWTLVTVTGEAPAGTAFARLTLITGDFRPDLGAGGGAPRYDDAFFEQLVIPEPGSMALLGLGGLALFARRRRA